jgi:hypothetical protein
LLNLGPGLRRGDTCLFTFVAEKLAGARIDAQR